MTTVQVQYDGYNRQLKILNKDARVLHEEGEVYTLAFLESDSGMNVEWIEFVDDAASTNKG